MRIDVSLVRSHVDERLFNQRLKGITYFLAGQDTPLGTCTPAPTSVALLGPFVFMSLLVVSSTAGRLVLTSSPSWTAAAAPAA
jgi:hypothetical protein